MFRRRMSDEEVAFMYKMNEILGNPHVSGVTRQATQLMPFLYLGGIQNAESLHTLRTQNITYVLNCAGTAKQKGSPYLGLGIEYHQFIADDDDNYNISQHFGEAFNFIEKAKRKGAKILVHCAMGINRSGAVCAAYVMKERRMSLLDTMRFLKINRIVALTNIGFRFQLIQFARNYGLLDPIDAIKKEIEKGFSKDKLFSGSSYQSNPSYTSLERERSAWKVPEYTPRFRSIEPRENTFRPVELPVNEERIPRPRITPGAYKTVDYEGFIPAGGKGPIIDPELLQPEDRRSYHSRNRYAGGTGEDYFRFTPKVETFRVGHSVNIARRHSLAPSMTHYDDSRFIDPGRRTFWH